MSNINIYADHITNNLINSPINVPINIINSSIINTPINVIINSPINVPINTLYNSPINAQAPINLIIFGEDGINDLTYDDTKHLLTTNENLVVELIKRINLDSNKPKHHNILYTNLRSVHGQIFTEEGWVFKKISEICDTLIDAKLKDLTNFLNEHAMLQEIKNKINDIIQYFDSNNTKARRKLTGDLKAILYNKRAMVMETKKLATK